MRNVKPLMRFRDESVAGLREGKLGEVNFKGEEEIYYQACIGGKVFSGIRIFPKWATFVSVFRLRFGNAEERLREAWKKVVGFVGDRPAELAFYSPEKLTLVYGFREFEHNYSSVFTAFGTFSFVEASTEEATSYGLPVRDLKGKDLSIARTLFMPTFHSFLSLRVLNLFGG